jgi:hypothetical protein
MHRHDHNNHVSLGSEERLVDLREKDYSSLDLYFVSGFGNGFSLSKV